MKIVKTVLMLALLSQNALAQEANCTVEEQSRKASYKKVNSCLKSLGEPKSRLKDHKDACRTSLQEFIEASKTFLGCTPSSESLVNIPGIKTVSVDGAGPCLKALNTREKALIKVKSCVDGWSVLTHKPTTLPQSDCQTELSVFHTGAQSYIECIRGKQ